MQDSFKHMISISCGLLHKPASGIPSMTYSIVLDKTSYKSPQGISHYPFLLFLTLGHVISYIVFSHFHQPFDHVIWLYSVSEQVSVPLPHSW
jgi:hypothetical protein